MISRVSGKWQMYFTGFDGHATSSWPGSSGAPDGVHGGHPRGARVDEFDDLVADARHDLHARHDVRGVGELHAEPRQLAADRAHREGHHVEGAATHRALEETGELVAHLDRIAPVVGGAGVRRVLGADEGARLDAGDIVRVAARQEAVRPVLGVELQQAPLLDHLVDEAVELGARAVDPDDAVGLEQSGVVVDPGTQLGAMLAMTASGRIGVIPPCASETRAASRI